MQFDYIHGTRCLVQPVNVLRDECESSVLGGTAILKLGDCQMAGIGTT
jgi:hypothetical protein